MKRNVTTNMSVQDDSSLMTMLNFFTPKNAAAWLYDKFDSYDSEAGVTALSAFGRDLSKDEKLYFANVVPLGFITGLATKDGLCKPLIAVAIKMKKELTDRTSRAKQFALAKKIVNVAFAHPEYISSTSRRNTALCTAGIFFFFDSAGNFRISLVTCTLKGRTLVSTTAKRQSFFCRRDAKNNIVKRQLNPAIKTFEDLQKAFSVEAITQEFYKKLFNWYEWACAAETKVTFPNKIKDKNDDREKLPEAIIRMITRLMFVWFVRQKGLIPDDLFNREKLDAMLKNFAPNATNDGTYYRAILQNLFFATLNCPTEKRRFAQKTNTQPDKRDWAASDFRCSTLYRYQEAFVKPNQFEELMRKIPFLNCALFDCLDKRLDAIEDADEIQRNGGEKEIYLDGFSRKANYQAFVPNALFFYDQPNDEAHEGLISLFDQYEFTIDENTADDADVALDPELLGKVFENLLGSFNKETQEVARNATGSFYTPREIVDYMAAESLKNYLKGKVPDLTDADLTRLFDRADETNAQVYLKPPIVTATLNALYACKILDPACGSGAFPMGLLHQMTLLFSKLDNKCTSIRQEISHRYKDDKAFILTDKDAKDRLERLNDIEALYKDQLHHPDYTRKLFIIENCIYGVDIQPIATQISKLRFFISLLCDQLRNNREVDAEGRVHYNLLALPNLEAKFVCANTLVALPKLGDELDLSNQEIQNLRQKLIKQRQRYFFARTFSAKKNAQRMERKIRCDIKAAVKKVLCKPDAHEINKQLMIISALKKEYEAIREPKWSAIGKPKLKQSELFEDLSAPQIEQGDLDLRIDLNAKRRAEIEEAICKARAIIAKERAKATQAQTGSMADNYAEQVANWDPYDQNASSPFFDPDWMFGIKDGFDIVIGNPPYVSLEGQFGELYGNCDYETIASRGDLYCLFYERGCKLLTCGGCLTYITSNKWMHAKYGKSLRKYLAEKTNPKILIDFGGNQIFESAAIDTNILLVIAGVHNQGKTWACKVKKIGVDFISYLSNHSVQRGYLSDEVWNILSNEEEAVRVKIQRAGIPLKDWNVEINYGIKTGYNDAFIIDEQKRVEICASDPHSMDIIRPILRGRDLLRYSFQSSGLYVILAKFGSHEYLEKRYPAIYKHLLAYKNDLMKRGQCRYSRSGKSSSKGFSGQHHWLELDNNPKDEYLQNFNKRLIVYNDITQKLNFVLTDGVTFINNTIYFLVTDEKIAYYFLPILNSSIIDWYYRTLSVQLGARSVRMFTEYVKDIPIPRMDEVFFKNTKVLVDRILAAKMANPEADTTDLERAIDQLVYKLYKLTPKEIAIVEGKEKGSGGKNAKAKSTRAKAVKAESADTPLADDDYEVLD